MSEHRDPATDQVAPTPNGKPAVWLQVIADMQARHEHGVRKYGTPLQPHNGRDALRDLYEELLDGAVYARQRMIEESDGLPGKCRDLVAAWREMADEIDRRAGESNTAGASVVRALADILESTLDGTR